MAGELRAELEHFVSLYHRTGRGPFETAVRNGDVDLYGLTMREVADEVEAVYSIEVISLMTRRKLAAFYQNDIKAVLDAGRANTVCQLLMDDLAGTSRRDHYSASSYQSQPRSKKGAGVWAAWAIGGLVVASGIGNMLPDPPPPPLEERLAEYDLTTASGRLSAWTSGDKEVSAAAEEIMERNHAESEAAKLAAIRQESRNQSNAYTSCLRSGRDTGYCYNQSGMDIAGDIMMMQNQ